MITRKEHMALEYVDAATAMARHREYYSQFVTPKAKQLVLRHIGREKLLRSTDPYLNDIKLSQWDRLVGHIVGSEVVTLLREAGDFLSLGTGVCILKEAARQIIEEERVK